MERIIIFKKNKKLPKCFCSDHFFEIWFNQMGTHLMYISKWVPLAIKPAFTVSEEWNQSIDHSWISQLYYYQKSCWKSILYYHLYNNKCFVRRGEWKPLVGFGRAIARWNCLCIKMIIWWEIFTSRAPHACSVRNCVPFTT